jgi:aldose 1-epimerase
VIAPEHGGAVLGWAEPGVPILRLPSPEAVAFGDVHAMGCFPLVPYCNRIARAAFRWQGRDFRIARNFGDHPHAIHGIGWLRPWTVEAARDNEAILSLAHRAEGAAAAAWPFAFEARLVYRLLPIGLSVTLSATNRHAGPAPMGIGLHPWFPSHHAPTLTFQATAVWENDETVLPARHVPMPSSGSHASWSHAGPRPVGSLALDNCFTGWNGAARIAAGPASLTLLADSAFGNLQVFTPLSAGFFCVEPVSHTPDAINRSGLPEAQAMTALAAGETLSGTVTLLRTRPDGG